MSESKRISQTELKDFRNCRRKWFIRYVLRLQPKREAINNMYLGSLVHSVLEAVTLGEEDWTALLDSLQEVEMVIRPEEDHRDVASMFRYATAMVRGYLEWVELNGLDSEWELIGPERMIDATLASGIHLIGKTDLLRRHVETADLSFVDFKITAQPWRITYMRDMEEQFKHYAAILLLSDEWQDGEATGVRGFWRVLKKSTHGEQALKKGDYDYDDYFTELSKEYTGEEIDNYLSRVEGIVSDIVTVEHQLNMGRDPQTVAYPTPNYNNCSKCPYALICPMFDDGSRVQDYIDEYYYTDANPLERYGDD